jgi:hypothetical protein
MPMRKPENVSKRGALVKFAEITTAYVSAGTGIFSFFYLASESVKKEQQMSQREELLYGKIPDTVPDNLFNATVSRLKNMVQNLRNH